MKRQKLIHCSFDCVYTFEPRVPETRIKGGYEDDKIKRICVAPSIKDCLLSIPGAGITVKWLQYVGLPVIIHAYYLEADCVEYDTSDYVLDAEATHEMWVLEKPKDWHRVDYEILSCWLEEGNDLLGKPMVWCRNPLLKRVPYTDTFKTLIDGMGLDYEEFRARVPFATIRGMAVNLSDGVTDYLRDRYREGTKKADGRVLTCPS